jgi:glutathione S-transferase
MLGDRPGLPDALCYHVVWFVRDRYRGGPGLLSEMPMLLAWEERVRKIGHGNPTAMTSTAALELAGAASPAAAAPGIDDDVQNLRAGMSVSVTPDDDGGDPEVYGLISYLDHDSVTLLRRDPAAGEIAVHFPRVGYRVRPRRGGVRAAATR